MKSRTGYVQIVTMMESNRERTRNAQQPLGSRFGLSAWILSCSYYYFWVFLIPRSDIDAVGSLGTRLKHLSLLNIGFTKKTYTQQILRNMPLKKRAVENLAPSALSVKMSCQAISALAWDAVYSNVHSMLTTSLLSVWVCADIIHRHTHTHTHTHIHTHSHRCLMALHQQHCRELSLFIAALLSRVISQMEPQLFHFTHIAYLCLSFALQFVSLFVLASKWLRIDLSSSPCVFVHTAAAAPKGLARSVPCHASQIPGKD